jgi:thiamine pyrophosphate-dependent acetolactate synthase large subunit-like protein
MRVPQGALKSFAELVNAPVITTLKAKGAFPENHHLFVGVRGDHTVHYLERSDLILAVGTSLSPGRFSHAIPGAADKTIIHCNIDELHVNKIYPTPHALWGCTIHPSSPYQGIVRQDFRCWQARRERFIRGQGRP